MPKAEPASVRRHPGVAALTLGALGVVFGDIGTSPLYALQAVFAADDGAVKPTSGDVYGIISLVVWSITLIVSIKFVTFIMRADNDGEGGIMALMALIRHMSIGIPPVGPHRRRPSGSLFYGDGMITPDLGAVGGRGHRGGGAEPGVGRPYHPRRAGRAVRAAAVRHRAHRPPVRPGHGPLVRRARRRRYRAPAAPSRHPQGAVPHLRDRLLRRPPGYRVHLAGIGRADGHRGRGALRGHGALRPAADQPGVVLRGVPGADAQLHGPGIADHRRPHRDLQPVLPPAARMVPGPDGRRCHDGHPDRVAGRDLGRVLGHAPGGAARIPAAPGHPPHLRLDHRPGVRPRGELDPLRCGDRPGDRVRLVGQAGHRLRHRGDGHPADRLHPVPRRRAAAVAQAVVDGGRGVLGFVTVDLLFLAANVTKIEHGGWFPLLIGTIVSSPSPSGIAAART